MAFDWNAFWGAMFVVGGIVLFAGALGVIVWSFVCENWWGLAAGALVVVVLIAAACAVDTTAEQKQQAYERKTKVCEVCCLELEMEAAADENA